MDNKAYDITRTDFLREKGFKVIRFWDNQVLREKEAVTSRILSALTPTLSATDQDSFSRAKHGRRLG